MERTDGMRSSACDRPDRHGLCASPSLSYLPLNLCPATSGGVLSLCPSVSVIGRSRDQAATRWRVVGMPLAQAPDRKREMAASVRASCAKSCMIRNRSWPTMTIGLTRSLEL